MDNDKGRHQDPANPEGRRARNVVHDREGGERPVGKDQHRPARYRHDNMRYGHAGHVLPLDSQPDGCQMRLKNAFGFDILAACSGFIFALVTAAQYIETGRNKKVIVVGGDKMSSIIDRPTGLPCPFSATVQRQYSLNPTQKDTASSTPSPEATATGASIST